MALVPAFPFQIAANGDCVLVDADSDIGRAQDLAILIQTRPGERPLIPGFGITDPAFRGVDTAELAAAVAAFGPPVSITGVDISTDPTGLAVHAVSFTVEDADDLA